MLNIVAWWWGEKYPLEYVEKLAAGLRRHLKQEYRFAVVTDKKVFPAGVDDIISIPESSFYLLGRGCFIRLRMFDPEWQAKHGFTERIVNIDLDSVITGPLDYLFDRPEPFVIMSGGNSSNPNPYGGALQMLRVGHHLEVWETFSLREAQKIPFASFPDDQAWIHVKIPNAAIWKVGADSGVYCFQKPGWTTGLNLPLEARIVTFRNNNLPSQYVHLDWIKEHWRV